MRTGFMSVRDLNPREVRDKVRSYRSLNVNLTQVQPVVGLVEFLTNVDVGPPIVNSILQGQERTMFQDAIGDSNAGGVDPGGIGLQRCDASFFDSQVPNGQLILLEGLGLSIQSTEPANVTAADVINMISAMSVLMNLRQRPVPMSALIDWPSIVGNDTIPNNGRQIVGRVQFDEPILLEPQDNFQLVFRAERQVILSSGTNQYQIRAYMPATRIYDERVLGVS
jgi:hypothetical protein